MAERAVKVIVGDAASGDWSIPEFQRAFEWKPEQVAMLCNSLYQQLPIGIFTVWNTTRYNEPRVRPVTGRKPLWVVDGQQRITALSIITGSKPNWMANEEWCKIFNKNRIYLNVTLDGTPTVGRLAKKAALKIPLDELIHKTPGEAQRYVQGRCTESSILQSQPSADLAVNALGILERTVPVAEIGEDKSIELIAEIYRRLNQLGTKLRQAQIMLAWVSQYNPGWVREEFYPFLEDLKNRDEWELDPAHVLQCATILAEGKARVGEASDDMWKSKVMQLWPNLRGAIYTCILHLWDRGISDQDMVPSSYTLIALFSIQAKFANAPGYDFNSIFRWFALANLSARYSDAPLETLTNDGHAIHEASKLSEALDKIAIAWTKDDLRGLLSESFRDNSSQALLLHMLLWSPQVKDWLAGHSIPALTNAPDALEPHWHHIVPKAWGRQHGFKDCDRTANVTRLCGETNVRKLRAKPPWEYVPEFGIPKDALVQHLVPDRYAEKFVRGQLLSPAEFEEFLNEREDLIFQQGASLLAL